MKLQIEQPVDGESSVYLLRSKLRAISRRMGFSEGKREHMELACNEIVTNISKYAGGRGLVQLWEQPEEDSLHIFALDYGPGIANLPSALADGFTSGGTLGKGLGTIQRVSDDCSFFTLADGVAPSAPWHGLAIWACFRTAPSVHGRAYQYGLYLRAYHDAIHNGDHTCLDVAERYSVRWVHLDGLGHGQEAAEAVSESCYVMENSDGPEDTLMRLSRQLQGSRGAVAIAGDIDFEHGSLLLSGVGDMSAWLIGNSTRNALNFSPGILGHAHAHFETLKLDMPSHALLLTASDGIRKSWEVNHFPGLWRCHPQLIAFFLGEVIGRTNDDRSLFVIRTHTQGEQDGKA